MEVVDGDDVGVVDVAYQGSAAAVIARVHGGAWKFFPAVFFDEVSFDSVELFDWRPG